MQYIFNLNFSLPEIFLSLSILGQLLFGSFVAYNRSYRYPIILNEVSFQSQLIGVILVILYFIQFSVVSDSTGLYNGGIIISKIIVSLASLAILLFLKDALEAQKINQFEYFFFYMMALLSLLLMLNVNDLLLFYLTMETQTLCFYILASANRTNIFSIEAALKYFIAGSFFSAVYLLGTAIIYGCLGTINLSNIYALLVIDLASFSTDLTILVLVGIVLITSTLLFKISSVPFHFWMPDVYEGAPISSTMVFSILPKFSLIFFFIKWISALGTMAYYIKDILVFFGVLSCIVGTLYAIKQLRIKRMMLYSSIAQVGFIIAAIGVNTLESHTAALFFTIIYIITSLLMWGNLVLIYKAHFEVSLVDDSHVDPLHINNFSNIISYNYLWKGIFTVIFFSIAGIPPFVGFTSKFLVLKSLVADHFLIASIFLIVASSISVFYYIRILKIAFFESNYKNIAYNETQNSVIKTSSDELFYKHFSILVLTISLVFFFFFPNILFTTCEYIVLECFTVLY